MECVPAQHPEGDRKRKRLGSIAPNETPNETSSERGQVVSDNQITNTPIRDELLAENMRLRKRMVEAMNELTGEFNGVALALRRHGQEMVETQRRMDGL